jgi:aerobic carbon-monoxide dehydrogenase medium subunit
MPASFALLRPDSDTEVVDNLTRYGPDARIVAGATALTILLRQGLIRPSALVSLERVPGLSDIRLDDGYVTIGARVTHRSVETSPLVRQLMPALALTFGQVANIRVRNAATVGGVLAEADYASDPPAALLALGASVETLGPDGRQEVSIGRFFTGFYETVLAPNQLVTGVRIPIPSPSARAVYEKFATRSSEDRPCVGVFALVRLADDGRTCADLRVSVGAAAEVPQLFEDVLALARGRVLDDELIRGIADQYAERIETISDMRGTAWYRTEMVRVWVRRALERAHEQSLEAAA